MNAESLRALDQVRLAAASGRHRVSFDRVDPDTRQLLQLASEIGAPLTVAADLAYRRITDDTDVSRAVMVASAEARTVAAFLLVAPLFLLPLTGRVLGVSVWPFFAQPAGRGVLIVAAGLYAGGFMVVGQLRRSLATPVVHTTGNVGVTMSWVIAGAGLIFGQMLVVALAVTVGVFAWRRRRGMPVVPLRGLAFAADVVVVAAGAGQSVPQALRHAADLAPELAQHLRQIAFALDCGVPPGATVGLLGQFATIAWQAHHSGAPAVAVFRQFSAQVRADERSALLARTARLPARLTVPTTLFFLPATVLVMVAPVIAHGLTALTV
jgi:uncharacterized membrane protein